MTLIIVIIIVILLIILITITIIITTIIIIIMDFCFKAQIRKSSKRLTMNKGGTRCNTLIN